MKRLIVLGLLAALAGSVWAADQVALRYRDVIGAADTAAASKRVDTSYSGWINISDVSRLQFYIYLDSGATDTNWTNDTFFVKFQTSFDKSKVRTWELDTLLTYDSAWSSLNVAVADSLIGEYGRAMLIHWDSLEATGPALLNNVYTKYLTVFLLSK